MRKAWALEHWCSFGFNTAGFVFSFKHSVISPKNCPDGPCAIQNNETNQSSPSPKGEWCYFSAQMSRSPKYVYWEIVPVWF